jgi:trk system potassium uptake protein TrkA
MALAPLIVIVGCGRLGSHFAERLDQRGCLVRLVDRDAAAFALLPAHLSGNCFEGEALDPAVLRRAGIERATHVIAATPKDDRNLAVAVVCRKAFGVSIAIARVGDPQRAESFREFGIRTVCPTALAGSAVLSMIEESRPR